MRRRFRRASGGLHLVLVAFLLAPMLLHGHRHAALHASPASCAICVATHHTPGLQAPPVVAPTPLACALVLTSTVDVSTAFGVARPHTGRGPPLALTQRTA